jgi:hypothetical protein
LANTHKRDHRDSNCHGHRRVAEIKAGEAMTFIIACLALAAAITLSVSIALIERHPRPALALAFIAIGCIAAGFWAASAAFGG